MNPPEVQFIKQTAQKALLQKIAQIQNQITRNKILRAFQVSCSLKSVVDYFPPRFCIFLVVNSELAFN